MLRDSITPRAAPHCADHRAPCRPAPPGMSVPDGPMSNADIVTVNGGQQPSASPPADLCPPPGRGRSGVGGPGLVDLAAGEETIWADAATPARMVHPRRLIDLETMLLGRPGGVRMRYGAAERCPVNTSRSMPTATMLPSSILVVATCREDLHQRGDQREVLVLGVLGGRRRGVGHAHVVAAGGRCVSGGYPAGWCPVPGVRYAGCPLAFLRALTPAGYRSVGAQTDQVSS